MGEVRVDVERNVGEVRESVECGVSVEGVGKCVGV